MKLYLDDTGHIELDGTFIELNSGIACVAAQVALRGYLNGMLTPDEIDNFVVQVIKQVLVQNRCILANKYPDKFSYLKPKDSNETCA